MPRNLMSLHTPNSRPPAWETDHILQVEKAEEGEKEQRGEVNNKEQEKQEEEVEEKPEE